MSAFAEVAARLLERAGRIAAAKTRFRQLERHDPAARWRDPALVWPLFTKG